MQTAPPTFADDLILGIKAGDRRAFELFYRMEHDNIVHFSDSYLHDRQAAEDIAQDSLLKVWERRDSLDAGGNLRSLTYRIARNRTIDYIRSYRPHALLQECEALTDPSLDGLIETLDLQKLVQHTFASLPEKVRDTFVKSRREGYMNKEIASAEGITEKAVEYRIGSALKIFRKIIR